MAQRQQGKPRNFVNLLSDELKSQGVAFEELDHAHCNWSGNKSHDERRMSATGLKKLIEQDLRQVEHRTGKPYREYYDGGVFMIAHSHGGTISRIVMNLWNQDAHNYGPETRVDPTTKAVLFDELKHGDHCMHYRQQRNGDVGIIAHPERLQAVTQRNTWAHRMAQIARWALAAVFVLGIFAAAVPIAGYNQAVATASAPNSRTTMREKASQPGATLRECDPVCPLMVVVPAGRLMMRSADGEGHVGERMNNTADAHALSATTVVGTKAGSP